MAGIFIGFPFAQDFETDPGAISEDAVLWLNLRRAGYQRGEVFGPFDFTRLSPTQFRLELSAAQTSAFSPGEVEGDIMQRSGQNSTPLGLRITIPVEATI